MTHKWPVEEKISSVREMAATIEVNPNTIMRTYSHLQEMGIIYNKRGIGYFVASGAPKKILDMQKQEFVKEVLPEVFKKMELLKLDFKELEKIYQATTAKGSV